MRVTRGERRKGTCNSVGENKVKSAPKAQTELLRPPPMPEVVSDRRSAIASISRSPTAQLQYEAVQRPTAADRPAHPHARPLARAPSPRGTASSPDDHPSTTLHPLCLQRPHAQVSPTITLCTQATSATATLLPPQCPNVQHSQTCGGPAGPPRLAKGRLPGSPPPPVTAETSPHGWCYPQATEGA